MAWQERKQRLWAKTWFGSWGMDKTTCGRHPWKIAMENHRVLFAVFLFDRIHVDLFCGSKFHISFYPEMPGIQQGF